MAFAVGSRFKRYSTQEISQKHGLNIITFSFTLWLEKMSSLLLLSVPPIYLGSTEGEGGSMIYMVIVFKSVFIPFYKWLFKTEGKKCILFLDGNNVVGCTVQHDSYLPAVIQS